ncbi:hypothetical protein FB451DRAFT_1343219 [Mycena latifolia]|nr:hypothetical protein FB451DRAFT_1343219 [Mycena latifolia]
MTQNEQFLIPPSPELDQAWSNLYNFGISQIPKSQAALLPNKTQAIPGDEENYIVELEVFHNLHCLNMLRKRLRSDYYTDSLAWTIPHLEHCIDWIRQSLIWQWDAVQNMSTSRGDVVHTCRNFDKLRDWGKSHKIRSQFNGNIRIEDDIVIPEIPKQFDL